ncbi:MAG: phosphatidylserine decarboxylase [bacterium]|nr:phosphatidylserine decarboxylase [bacterium]
MKFDREVWPIAGVLALLAIAAGALLHPVVVSLPAGLMLFTFWFMRDPTRSPPDEPGVLISPADGKILKTGLDKISVFMNVFNVHVCRTPLAGVVRSVQHTPGRFLAAWRDDASEHNERTRIEIVPEAGEPLIFTLVAGLVARRIVCRVRPGDELVAGQRVGLIRFGSRVDVRLPPGGEVAVRPNQRVFAGRTILARLSEAERAAPAEDPGGTTAQGGFRL